MSETEIKSINSRTLCDNTARQSIETLSSQLAALALQVDGNKLKLLKGNEVLSTVTLPTSSGTPETYTITNTLTHVTNSNTATSISENGSYTATLSASTGYDIGTPVIKMGGTDITSSCYNSSTHTINISSVTGNVTITCSATIKSYTVTNTLSNCSSSNSATSANYGTSYAATITPTTDYELGAISVSMGGMDISSSAVSGSSISISSVTGNILISCTAMEIDHSGDTVGTINSSNEISLSGLSAGTYTLKYEDSTGTPLTDWDSITDMEVE